MASQNKRAGPGAGRGAYPRMVQALGWAGGPKATHMRSGDGAEVETDGVGPYNIEVVERSLDVLSVFDYRSRWLTVAEIAQRLGTSRSKTYRIVQTLVSKEFLAADAKREHYCLGRAAARLGMIARTNDRFSQVLLAEMHRLHQEFAETVNFAVVEGNAMVYAEVLESPHPFRISDQIGSHADIALSALGRAVLAAVRDPESYIPKGQLARLKLDLEHIRALGYAVDNEYVVPGARCVGVAIEDPGHRVFGALSVSGPSGRVTEELVPVIGRRLKDAAAQINMRARSEDVING